MPHSGEDHFLLEDLRRVFALALDDLDGAERATLRSMCRADEAGEGDSAGHHTVFNHCGLCAVAFKREAWGQLAEQAAAGEREARRIGYKLQISECQMWLALLARRAGDEARARPLHARAVGRVGRVRKPPSAAWFDGLAACEVWVDDLPAALRVRDRELATVRDHGRLAYECHCHVERCRLLAKMGRPLDEVLAQGRAAAARLRDPAPELEKLMRAARGEAAKP